MNKEGSVNIVININMRLLLVEDDNNLGHATAEGLRESYAVDWAKTGAEASRLLSIFEYDLIVLDIGLPDITGLQILNRFRKENELTPVIILTARDSVSHRIEGLNAGADDYLVKPFDLDELLARCAAVIRRTHGTRRTIIHYHDIHYDTLNCTIKKNNQTIVLTHLENAIFDYLIRNVGKPISKYKLLNTMYDSRSYEIESNTIEVHVASLRRKLGSNIIKTIRNIGYMMPA